MADTFEVVGGSSMTGFCYFFYVCSLYVPIFDLTDVVGYVLADIICNKSSAIVSYPPSPSYNYVRIDLHYRTAHPTGLRIAIYRFPLALRTA